MEKSKFIKKIIAKLQTGNELDGGLFFSYDDYNDIRFDDLVPYFDELNNIEIFWSSEDFFDYDIYSDLEKLKNIKKILFNESDLSETEKYINEGLKKFPKLETLMLVITNLARFPKQIYEIPTLKNLSLYGNNFYTQNFHIELKEEFKNKNIYENIKKIADEKCEQNEILQDCKYFFHEYPWGLANHKKGILILKDNFINEYENINSLSFYVLKEKNHNPNEIFNTYKEFFIEINAELKCFKTNEKDNLDLFFFYGYNIFKGVYFEKLKNLQKSGEPEYENIGFVNDLLIYIGGKKLISEIEKEHENEELQKSKSFYKYNRLINSIKIENFKLFDKIKIEKLADINILIGKNGAGKTSLLQAIAASLTPHFSKDLKSNSKFLNINLDGKPYSSRFAKTNVKWENFEKSQRIFSNEIRLENVRGKKNELPESFLVLAYGENLYAQEHPFEKEKLSYRDVLANGNYKNYNTTSIFVTAYNKMPNPLEILNSLSEKEIPIKYEKQKKELLLIGLIIKNKINKFLEKYKAQKIKIEKYKDYYKFRDGKGHYLDFDQISEGYRSYIILLTDIILRIIAARKTLFLNDYSSELNFEKVKGAIIIDEFDKHLHPTWQRTFLKTLKIEFPQIQFFLSTHNIVSLQSAEGEKVFVLNINEEGKIEIKNDKIPLNCSVETIYKHYFNENF